MHNVTHLYFPLTFLDPYQFGQEHFASKHTIASSMIAQVKYEFIIFFRRYKILCFDERKRGKIDRSGINRKIQTQREKEAG